MGRLKLLITVVLVSTLITACTSLPDIDKGSFYPMPVNEIADMKNSLSGKIPTEERLATVARLLEEKYDKQFIPSKDNSFEDAYFGFDAKFVLADDPKQEVRFSYNVIDEAQPFDDNYYLILKKSEYREMLAKYTAMQFEEFIVEDSEYFATSSSVNFFAPGDVELEDLWKVSRYTDPVIDVYVKEVDISNDELAEKVEAIIKGFHDEGVAIRLSVMTLLPEVYEELKSNPRMPTDYGDYNRAVEIDIDQNFQITELEFMLGGD